MNRLLNVFKSCYLLSQNFFLVKRTAFLAACFFVKDEVFWILTNCPLILLLRVDEKLYIMKEVIPKNLQYGVFVGSLDYQN